MLAVVRGLNQRLFNFERHLTLPLMATTRVSAFSTGSPNNAPLKRVGTHNGSFHCDEALGCFMIRLTDKFSGAEIVRTRDPQVLDGLDAVLDVGGVYDPSQDRYDHHQKGFNEVFGHGFSTKLSSAGLVYKHFGKEIIAKELQLDEEHLDVHRLFLAVYKSFMEAIDAIDNGINKYDTDQPPRYVNNTNLSSRVGRLNLDWMDPDQSSEKENEAFHRAMALAGSEFLDSVRYYVKSWLPARSIVMECLAARGDIYPSGEIMVLTKFCPDGLYSRGAKPGMIITLSIWPLGIMFCDNDPESINQKTNETSATESKRAAGGVGEVIQLWDSTKWKLHLFELEQEMKIDPPIKYVLYQDDRSKHWRVQAVAVSPDKFESRKPLPSQWRGLRDEELSRVAGIPGCVFVHMSGFIGGNHSYEGALAMAKAGLKL